MPDRVPGRAALAALALSLLSLPVSAAPGTEAVRAAREALTRQDGISAEVELQRALRAGVPRAAIAAYFGEAEFIQGDLEDARDWLEPGEFSADTAMRGFHMLARLEIRQENFAAALTAFDHALDFGPGTAELWVDIARLHYLAGRHFQALDASATALQRDPADPRALEFKALLVRDSEGLKASLPWFAKGLASAPDDLSLLGEYAAVLGELGRGRDMLAVTRRMIELDPKNLRAFYLQAVLAARAGKDGLARRLLARTGNALEGIPAKLMLEGILELRAGNPALAVEAFAGLARAQPDNSRAQEFFARALLENGEPSEVAARYAPIADRPDASAYLLTLVGRAFEQLGARERAARYLDRAAIDPESSFSILPNGDQSELLLFRFGDDAARLDVGIARVRRQIGSELPAEAAETIAGLREHYAGSADFLTLAGDVALARGDAEGALVEYRAAARVRRSLAMTAKMAVALEQLGRLAEARALVLDYLSQHPLDRDAAWLAARLASDAGDWRQARALATHIHNTELLARDPRVLAMLALSQLQLGDVEAAHANALAANRMQPMNVSVAAVLARTLRQSGGKAADIAALEAKVRQAGN